MKLNDLIKSNSWLSVELTLLKLYPDQIEMVDEYRKVFEKLRILKPEDDNMKIVLTEYDCDTVDDCEKSTYVDVAGRLDNNHKNTITDSYAIEFVEWKKWLGMDLAPETIKNFTDLEIIVHCLYEMTFIDYDEEDVKKQFDTIKDRVDEYKNLTEEEKKEKTITLDELKRRLFKEGSS